MMSAKEISALIKDWMDIVKSMVIMLIFGFAAYCLIWNPDHLKKVVKDFGVKKGSFWGIDFDIAEAADALPRTASALEQAKSQVDLQRIQYIDAIDALRKSEIALNSSSQLEKMKRSIRLN